MTVSSYEVVKVAGERVTADLLVWRRYRRKAPGVLEKLLDANPHLARLHRNGPFIPVGTEVRIPIDLSILAGEGSVGSTVTLYGRTNG